MATETCVLSLIHPDGTTTLKLDGTNGTAETCKITIAPKLKVMATPAKTYEIQIHKGIKTTINVAGVLDDYNQMEAFIGYAETWNRATAKYSQVLFDYQTRANVTRKGMLMSMTIDMAIKPGSLAPKFSFSISKGSDDA